MKCKIKMSTVRKKISEKIFTLIQKRRKFTYFCFGLIFLNLSFPVFSVTENKVQIEKNLELREQQDNLILEKTNDYYNQGKYFKAVEQINIAIEYHQENSTLPSNIQLMAEMVYYTWINSFYKNSKILKLKDYNKVMQYLTLHPEVISPRIEFLMNEIYHNEKNDLENKRIESIKKNNKLELDKILNQIYKLEKGKQDFNDVIAGTISVAEIKQATKIEQNYLQSQRIRYIMILLYFLIFVAIITLIYVIHRNHRNTLEAQKQFETTMKVVAILNQESKTEESPYKPFNENPMQETENANNTLSNERRKFGLSDYESKKIAISYFENETIKRDFLSLQNQCRELGNKIDVITGRKRNSKKVSELVFKLCKVANIDDELALIYYCAAMVYDAGFLSISKNILRSEHLTIKDRYEIRSHVQKATEYFGFIPESIKQIFLDAAEFHHENVNGKGYLLGLSGNKIPLIARLIRVAESYISLINSRAYRRIMDADSAMAELKRKNGIYDSKILNLLEKVI